MFQNPFIQTLRVCISGTSPSIIRLASVAFLISSTLTPGALSKSLNPFLVTSKTAKLVTTFFHTIYTSNR